MFSCLISSLGPTYIVPIGKEKHGDMSDPNKYKGTVISSMVSKAMEHVILDKFGHHLFKFCSTVWFQTESQLL